MRRALYPLTRKQVQQRAWLALGDPLLFYSIYGFAGAYIGNGSTTAAVPLIPLGNVRVLPSLGYALAPYGGEVTIRAAVQAGTGQGPG